MKKISNLQFELLNFVLSQNHIRRLLFYYLGLIQYFKI